MRLEWFKCKINRLYTSSNTSESQCGAVEEMEILARILHSSFSGHGATLYPRIPLEFDSNTAYLVNFTSIAQLPVMLPRNSDFKSWP